MNDRERVKYGKTQLIVRSAVQNFFLILRVARHAEREKREKRERKEEKRREKKRKKRKKREKRERRSGHKQRMMSQRQSSPPYLSAMLNSTTPRESKEK